MPDCHLRPFSGNLAPIPAPFPPTASLQSRVRRSTPRSATAARSPSTAAPSPSRSPQQNPALPPFPPPSLLQFSSHRRPFPFPDPRAEPRAPSLSRHQAPPATMHGVLPVAATPSKRQGVFCVLRCTMSEFSLITEENEGREETKDFLPFVIGSACCQVPSEEERILPQLHDYYIVCCSWDLDLFQYNIPRCYGDNIKAEHR
ncbi:hypothetical protein BRADI_4g08723v3 [Brachypodium distachyon]|uniref:Uncharacterized protein n=1 Tax=Brachypodium distachyon TaxID=15368 RepID=A0A0Q3PCQ6_BRADI|nr:hypothetical protein BRADI_4g08723v3 [Brachypodium distachyon]